MRSVEGLIPEDARTLIPDFEGTGHHERYPEFQAPDIERAPVETERSEPMGDRDDDLKRIEEQMAREDEREDETASALALIANIPDSKNMPDWIKEFRDQAPAALRETQRER